MGTLIGYVTVPRPVDSPRPAGAFFSATVESSIKPGVWKILLNGSSTEIKTTLLLYPGQGLRLQLTSVENHRWVLQVISQEPSKEKQTFPEISKPMENSLGQLFHSRGLSVAMERLSLWSEWLKRSNGPSDKDTWATSLESRDQPPGSALEHDLGPWLAWEESLEKGYSTPPPLDEEFWDRWNTRPSRSGDSWIAMPLRWDFEGIQDAGLLQAHWNPLSQNIDVWNLTACPAGVAFRLEARTNRDFLDLTWYFFNTHERKRGDRIVKGIIPFLDQTGQKIRIRVAAGPPIVKSIHQLGVDIEA